jgi:hypothetical protein
MTRMATFKKASFLFESEEIPTVTYRQLSFFPLFLFITPTNVNDKAIDIWYVPCVNKI